MALEDLTGVDKFIDDLVNTNPAAADGVAQGDDHIRGVKNVLLNTFPNITGAITPTETELNHVDGVTEDIQPALDNANAALAAVQALDPKQQPTVSNAADADHDLTMSTGFLLKDALPMEFTSAITKQTDAVWAAGNNAGGRAAGVTLSANQTLYLHALFNTTATTLDWGFDTSATATNLLADANVVAAGLTLFKPWFIFKTDASSNIRPLSIERTADGSDRVVYDSSVANVSGNVGTTAATFSNANPDGIHIGHIMTVSVGTSTSQSSGGFLDFGPGSVTYSTTASTNDRFSIDGGVTNRKEVTLTKTYYTNSHTFGYDASANFLGLIASTVGYTFNRQEL